MYVFINWTFCLLTTFFLFVILFRQRYLLIKPSMVVTLFFNLQIQWAGTIKAGELETYFPDPYVFALLIHGFPLGTLALSYFTARHSAKLTWKRLVNRPYQVDLRAVAFLLAYVIPVAAYYASVVPFANTGLYNIFTNPSMSDQMRAESSTLLGNKLVQYTFAILSTSFAPLLSAMSAHLLFNGIKQRKAVPITIGTVILTFCILVVSLPGQRGPSAVLLVAVILSFWLMKGLSMRPIHLCIALIVVLGIPAILSIYREGREPTVALFWTYLTDHMFGRVFASPLTTGTWYVHYVQTTHHFWGIAGLAKLTWYFGKESIWVPNVIALAYSDPNVLWGNANTSFVFAYYSYFGINSLPLCIVMTACLDVIVSMYRRISESILLPLVASVMGASLALIQTDFSVALISNGVGILPILGFIINHFLRLFPMQRYNLKVYKENKGGISPRMT